MLLLVAVPAASAAKFNTEVVLQGFEYPAKGSTIFYGTLNSSRRKCERNRKIDVFEDFKSPSPDPRVGTATSQSNGNWALYTINPGLKAGYYYAKARRKRIGDDVCKGDRSPSLLNA